MDNLRISVVIPVFNGERYLGQAIERALGQSHSPHQVIVVDDGSTDSSRDIAESFGDAIIFLPQINQGPGAARNYGVEKSSGEWIAFLDADDYWHPEKLAWQSAVVRDNPHVDLVYSGWTTLSDSGMTENIDAKPAAWVKKRLVTQCPIIPSTVLIRRSLMLQNTWSTKLRSSEDWWLFYGFSRTAEFASVENPTTIYRVHNESLTHRDWQSVLQYAQMVSARIQNDFTGIERISLKRMIDGRLLMNAAIAAREQGSHESFRLISKSLLAWPFPIGCSSRYKMFLKMLMQWLHDLAAPST